MNTAEDLKAQYLEAAIAYWENGNRSTSARRAAAARRAIKGGVDVFTVNRTWDLEASQAAGVQ